MMTYFYTPQAALVFSLKAAAAALDKELERMEKDDYADYTHEDRAIVRAQLADIAHLQTLNITIGD